MNYSVMVAKIIEIDSEHVFNYCPMCEQPTTISVEITGPLKDWNQCDRCRCWYPPYVKFKGENDKE